MRSVFFGVTNQEATNGATGSEFQTEKLIREARRSRMEEMDYG